MGAVVSLRRPPHPRSHGIHPVESHMNTSESGGSEQVAESILPDSGPCCTPDHTTTETPATEHPAAADSSSSPPSISSVAPTTATLNVKTTFVASGSHLPTTVVAWIANCDGMAVLSRTTTQFRFECTPKWATGSQAIEIKDAPGGRLLFQGTLSVR